LLNTYLQKYVRVLEALAGYSKGVVHSRQEATSGTGGTLADTHEGKPGLPRGRSRLPALEVQASQRERLLRAVVAAVAASDYAVVTVADIVRRARVSRAAFYTHFADKEACFLAAAREGGRLMDQRIVAATRAAEPGTTDEVVLRVAVRGFLTFVTGEPEFAKIFYIDMPAAGPHATEQLARAQHRYADLNQTWHERARTRHPGWPTLPYDAYQALAGATAELVRGRVRAGQISAVPALEDTLVALHLAVMTGQPWPAGPVPSAGASVTETSR
jgi:AcrR family transcriptional regulator